jgi:uncharacterized cupin superfamily protein
MTKPVVNIADIELQPRIHAFPATATGGPAEHYDASMGRISTRIGAQQLGYNITAVPPGKRAFPAHNHLVNEEMFFILAGSGELLVGANVYPLRSGDFVACPAGGIETAHQIVNTGSEELRYLAVSTARMPEVCQYPNSGKFGVYAPLPADGDGKSTVFRYLGREGQGLDYWDGE